MAWPPPAEDEVGVLDLGESPHTDELARPVPQNEDTTKRDALDALPREDPGEQAVVPEEEPSAAEPVERPQPEHEERPRPSGRWTRPAEGLTLRSRWFGSPGGRRITREHLALVVLALLVLAQGAFIYRSQFAGDGRLAGTDTQRVTPAPGDGTTGADASAGTGASEVAGSSGRSGRLSVRTEPAGAVVLLDGTPKGTAPLTVTDLGPGDHEVVIQHAGATIRERIHITPGETASLVVPLAPAARSVPAAGPAPSEGTLTVRSPIELRIFEGDRLIGTSAMERIRLSRGSHRLVLQNEDLGFEQTRTVTVSRGRTTSLAVDPPSGRVAINAVPWAEVWADGRRAGETPIGALRLPLGTHVLALRHPTLGEKSVEVTVKANETARVSVDMRK